MNMIPTNTKIGKTKVKTKQQTIIEATSTKQGLNRFEAQAIGDSCLNSTISSLSKLGYKFRTERETISNRFGGKTHCSRYWLIGKPQPKNIEKQ